MVRLKELIMSKSQRDKGARGERALVAALTAGGIHAERVPLSGAVGGSFKNDVAALIGGKKKDFEVKLRADGFKELYRWIEPAYGLAVKADRKPFLVVLRMEDFLKLAGPKELANGGAILFTREFALEDDDEKPPHTA